MNYPCSTCLNAECTSWSTSLSCQIITSLIIAIVMTGILMGILFIVMIWNKENCWFEK